MCKSIIDYFFLLYLCQERVWRYCQNFMFSNFSDMHTHLSTAKYICLQCSSVNWLKCSKTMDMEKQVFGATVFSFLLLFIILLTWAVSHQHLYFCTTYKYMLLAISSYIMETLGSCFYSINFTCHHVRKEAYTVHEERIKREQLIATVL